ncbi:MAG: ABC transporter ATP-binding protein [Erysipelotrichaceae bacterium]
MKELLTIHQLVKKYGDLTAVDGLDLSVYEGELFAFLGPNGAGKSTTINVLCTILPKTSGEITIDGLRLGKDDEAIRNKIGVVFQHSFLDDRLTVEENLISRASFYNLNKVQTKQRIKELTVLCGLGDFVKRPYGKLSGGQRRRADIARALLNRPKLLFLDEPTTGLDPQTRTKIWDAVEELRTNHGTTVFMTTHYMEEAARCDRVAILDYGKLLVVDTPMNLKSEYAQTNLKLSVNDVASVKAAMEARGINPMIYGNIVETVIKHSKDALPILHELEGQIDSFEVSEGNMDAVFMQFTGRAIRGEGEE